MSYKVRVDWFTVTGKLSGDEAQTFEGGLLQGAKLAHALVDGLSTKGTQIYTVPPERYYKYAFVDAKTKLRVNIGENLLQQGWKVEASGSACNELDVNVVLPAFVEIWKARVTRFDVAVDLIDSGIKPHEFAEECADEWGYDGGRLWNFRKGRTGNTVYIGSGSSERYFRFYDKGGEQGIPVDWMRAEMEYKGAFASHAYETYFTDYRISVSNTADFISLPKSPICKLLQRIAMGVEPEKLVKPRVVGDRVKWFNTQVMSAFFKLAAEDLEAAREVWEKFHNIYIAQSIWNMFNEELVKVAEIDYNLE